MSAENEICFMSARSLADSLRDRNLSAREVMTAFLEQIARVNPKINAIVANWMMKNASVWRIEADRRFAQGDDVGPLHGLPFAFKDLDAAVGFPMTRGSLIFKNFFPSGRFSSRRTVKARRCDSHRQDQCL